MSYGFTDARCHGCMDRDAEIAQLRKRVEAMEKLERAAESVLAQFRLKDNRDALDDMAIFHLDRRLKALKEIEGANG